MNNINTRNIDTRNIDTPRAILRVLRALDLRRGDVTDEQLDALNDVLTGFAIDSIEATGDK